MKKPLRILSGSPASVVKRHHRTQPDGRRWQWRQPDSDWQLHAYAGWVRWCLLLGLGLLACSSESPVAAPTSSTSGQTGGGGNGGSPIPTGNCSDDPKAPVQDGLSHLGRAEGKEFVEVLDVVQDHPIVFSCTSVQGLNIWDASADSGPKLLATRVIPDGLIGGKNQQLPHCQHVGLDAAKKQLAITNRGDEIQPQPFIHIYDVSDPSAPLALGGWTGAEAIEGVALRDGQLWAAAHSAGIVRFSFSGGALVELARYTDDESDGWMPLLYGDGHLLVAEGAAGLRVYDVSADKPALIATQSIDGSAKDVVVRDSVAYVAASSRIAAIDLSNPGSPKLIGELATTGTAIALALGRDDTLLVAEWDKLRGYDIADPANMKLLQSETLPTNSAFSRILTLDAAPGHARVYPGEWSGLHNYEQHLCPVGPDIETTPDQVSFPTVETGSFDVRALILRNNGNRTLVVNDILSQDAAVSVSETKLEVEPGAATSLEIKFAPSSSSFVQTELRFLTNDVDQKTFSMGVSGNITGVDVGDPLPSFSLLDTDGQMWTNQKLLGKVAVLAYFATF